MNDTGTQTSKRLAEVERLAKSVAQQILQSREGGIRGFLAELGKVRAHLAVSRDVKATRELVNALKADSAFVRSQQTRGYFDRAASVLTRLSQDNPPAERLLWSLGWFFRLLLSEERLHAPQRPGRRDDDFRGRRDGPGRPGGGRPGGPGRPGGRAGRPGGGRPGGGGR